MKLLSFSLYGKNLIYLLGAIEILKEQPKVYPGWCCRFYVAEDVVSGVIEELSAGGAEVIIMRPEPGAAGMFWRYLPADEENLEACLMLDVDSPLLERQKCATDEWLNSDQLYHVIRDHRHHDKKIMGGLFGMKWPSPIKLNIRQEVEDFILRRPNKVVKRGNDQIFLANRIYPRIKEHTLFHVDPGFRVFPGEIARPLPGPKRTESFFVGCYRPKNSWKFWWVLAVISIKHFQVKRCSLFFYKFFR